MCRLSLSSAMVCRRARPSHVTRSRIFTASFVLCIAQLLQGRVALGAGLKELFPAQRSLNVSQRRILHEPRPDPSPPSTVSTRPGETMLRPCSSPSHAALDPEPARDRNRLAGDVPRLVRGEADRQRRGGALLG